MSINVAERYEADFFVVREGRVSHDYTCQYGELIDLWRRYGEENVIPEDEASESIKVAYSLECLRPYLKHGSGLELSYDLCDKGISLRFPEMVEVCLGVRTDCMQFELNREGAAEAAHRISNWLFSKRERSGRTISFGEVIFPTLYSLTEKIAS